MVHLHVSDDVKMLRETLCVAQNLSVFVSVNIDITNYMDRLQELIDQCDIHRPLGPDGKHGDRHTATCGCEDKRLRTPTNDT